MTTVRTLLLLALALLPAGAAAQGTERDLAAVTKRLNALDSWLDDAGKRLAEQQRNVATADRRIAKSAKAMRDLDQRIRAGATQLEQLRGDGRTLDKQREQQARHLAEHLRAAWRMSAQDVLKLLLNNEDPAVAARLLRYQGYLAEARAQAIRALQGTTAAAIGNRAERERTQRELETARAAAARERKALLAERASQQRSVANLRAELASKGRERERVAADQERLRQLISKLATKPASEPGQRATPPSTPQPPAFRAGGSGLVWPVQGRLARRFGQARAGGRMRWQGVFIQAPLGADVRSAAGGEVVFADWLRGFGMLIIVDHGGGRMSLYGHADALLRRVGDRVEAGEAIASVGRSGGQDEAGLYLEVRQNGKPVDPLGWLRPVRGRAP